MARKLTMHDVTNYRCKPLEKCVATVTVRLILFILQEKCISFQYTWDTVFFFVVWCFVLFCFFGFGFWCFLVFFDVVIF